MPWGYAAAAGVSLIGANMAGDASQDAANTAAQGQREALDYQKEVERLPLQYRDQFLPMLAGFYEGGEGQNKFIEDTKASPFYSQMIQSGQEGVLDNAQAMGLSRSGNTTQDLSRSNQGVLQNLVNQRLMGASSMANMPLNTNAIAQSMSGIGQTLGQGQIGRANALQTGYGQAGQAMMSGFNQGGMFGG